MAERGCLGRELLGVAVKQRSGHGHFPVVGERLRHLGQEIRLFGGRLYLTGERKLALAGGLRSRAVAARLRAGRIDEIALNAVRIDKRRTGRRARRRVYSTRQSAPVGVRPGTVAIGTQNLVLMMPVYGHVDVVAFVCQIAPAEDPGQVLCGAVAVLSRAGLGGDLGSDIALF